MLTNKHFNALIIAVVTALFVISCGPGIKVAKNKPFLDANALVGQGRYAEALDIYMAHKGVIAWDSISLRNATIAASETNHDSLAAVWGFLYPSTADTLKLKSLGNSLKRLGRDEERTNLILSNENTFTYILGNVEIQNVKARFYAQNNDDRLLDLYPTLSDNTVKAEVFDTFFKKAQSQLTAKDLEKHCVDILKSTPNQTTALMHMGRSKYKQAETKYASAMDDYNKKKSQAAYAYLTRDLKKYVTPLYKESRTYFEKLLKLDSKDKTIVKYLININDRLNNQDEVKRLKKLL